MRPGASTARRVWAAAGAAALASVVGGSAAPAAGATVTYQTVARLRSAAPGNAPGTLFLNFYWPSINNAGQVVFSGTIFGGDASSDSYCFA